MGFSPGAEFRGRKTRPEFQSLENVNPEEELSLANSKIDLKRQRRVTHAPGPDVQASNVVTALRSQETLANAELRAR